MTKNTLEVSIDWLEFTVLDMTLAEVVEALMDIEFDEMSQLGGGVASVIGIS